MLKHRDAKVYSSLLDFKAQGPGMPLTSTSTQKYKKSPKRMKAKSVRRIENICIEEACRVVILSRQAHPLHRHQAQCVWTSRSGKSSARTKKRLLRNRDSGDFKVSCTTYIGGWWRWRENILEIVQMSVVGKQELSSASQIHRFWSLKSRWECSDDKLHQEVPIKANAVGRLLVLHDLCQLTSHQMRLKSLKVWPPDELIWITETIVLLLTSKLDGKRPTREKLES